MRRNRVTYAGSGVGTALLGTRWIVVGWTRRDEGKVPMRIRQNKTMLEQAADYVEAAVEKAGPILADAKERAESVLADAREQAGPALADAKDTLADARDKAVAKAGPALVDARDKATPLIAQSAALAAEKASLAAELASQKASLAADLAAEKAAQGKQLAASKAAELTGKPQKKHRLRKFLVLTGIAAVVGIVVKKMQSRGDQDNWQSTYTPPPRVTDTPIADAAAAASTGAADEGGAGPDEALADAVDEQHEVTTPDEPVEVVDLAPGEEPATNKGSKP
jgi:ElaB/YqjD/DUF883 family membrane-anchored ribosome-binding protein